MPWSNSEPFVTRARFVDEMGVFWLRERCMIRPYWLTTGWKGLLATAAPK
jgi:hypothetical protein